MSENGINEIQDLQILRAELSSAKKRVGELQQQVKRMEDVIYSKCDHQWIVDYSNVGEHTEHVCAKCNLSKK
jgi:hypothetical protein